MAVYQCAPALLDRPRGPFTMNEDCEQAVGLVAWFPFGPGMTSNVRDAAKTHTISPNGGPSWVGNKYIPSSLSPQLDGTSQYYTSSTVPLTAAPLSLVCWCIPSTFTTVNRHILGLYNTAGSSEWDIEFTTGGLIVARTATEASPSGSQSIGPQAAVVGQLHMVAAVFASNTSRVSYLDGGFKGTPQTTSRIPSGINTIGVGARVTSSLAQFYGGLLIDARIYNRALEDGEIAALFASNRRWELYWQPSRTSYFSITVGGAGKPDYYYRQMRA